MAKTQQELAELQVQLELQSNQFERGMKQAANRIKSFESSSRRTSLVLGTLQSRLGSITATTGRLSTAFGTMGIAVGAVVTAFAGVYAASASLQRLRDEAEILIGSFTTLTGSTERALALLEETRRVAQRVGTSFEEASSLTQRFAIGLAEIGASNSQIAQVVENILMLGRIGGSSMEDVSRAAFQLSQGLAAGNLAGEELRSVLENMPLVARRIANAMGITVGELREAGAAGEITSEILLEALSNSEGIAAAWEGMPETLDQVNARLLNTVRLTGEGLAQFISDSWLGDFASASGNMATGILSAINRELERSNLAEASKQLANIATEIVKIEQAGKDAGVRYAEFTDILDQYLQTAARLRLAENPFPVDSSELGKLNREFESQIENLKLYSTLIRQVPEGGRLYTMLRNRIEEVGNAIQRNLDRQEELKQAQADQGRAAETALQRQTRAWNKLNDVAPELLRPIHDLTVSWGRLEQKIKDNDIPQVLADQIAKTDLQKLFTAQFDLSEFKPTTTITQDLNQWLREFGQFVEARSEELRLQIIPQIEALLPNLPPEVIEAALAGTLQDVTAAFNQYFQQQTIDLEIRLNILRKEQMLRAIDPLYDMKAAIEEVYEVQSKLPDNLKLTAEQLATILQGISDRYAQLTEEITEKTLGEKWGEAISNMGESFADSLIDATERGKDAIGEFVEYALKELARIAIMEAMNPIFQGFGDWVGGIGTNSLMPGTLRATPMNQVTPFGPGAGTRSMVVGIPMPPSYNQGAAANQTGRVNVTVNNNAPVDVEVNRSQRGGNIDIEMVIEQKVNKAIAGGGIDRTMRSVYGVRRLGQ